MKRKSLYIVLAVLVVCLLSVGIIYATNSNDDNTSINSSKSNKEEKTSQSVSKNNLDSKEVNESINQEKANIDNEETKLSITSTTKVVVKNDKKEENKLQTEEEIKEDEELDEGEIFDSTTKDPFAEDQHKSDVPLVLIDSDGNQREPETVYWNEEKNQGTLDPGGYIPDGLPPGAVYVCDVTDEELERIKEEFNVGE